MIIYSIIIIAFIVLTKAIFSAADTAFTYMNKAEIKQLSKKDPKAKKIVILMEDTNKFFGIVEVVINMSELLASAVASITIVEYLIDFFENLGLSQLLSMIISVAIVTVILAYVMLVFGGVLPKRLARNHPKETAFRLIPILWIVAKLNYPFERIIDISTNILSDIFNIKQEDERMTEKQLKMILKEAHDEGVLESAENRILLNTIKANNLNIHRIMIPFEKTYMLDIDMEVNEILKCIHENKYTRIPVYKNDKNNIIGILSVKDLATQYSQEKICKKEQIEKIIRPPQYVYENEKIFKALKNFQKNRQIISIVRDKKNNSIGIISLEDILERLVGEILDEDD